MKNLAAKAEKLIRTFLPKGKWAVGKVGDQIQFFRLPNTVPEIVMQEGGLDLLLNGRGDPVCMEFKRQSEKLLSGLASIHMPPPEKIIEDNSIHDVFEINDVEFKKHYEQLKENDEDRKS